MDFLLTVDRQQFLWMIYFNGAMLSFIILMGIEFIRIRENVRFLYIIASVMSSLFIAATWFLMLPIMVFVSIITFMRKNENV